VIDEPSLGSPARNHGDPMLFSGFEKRQPAFACSNHEAKGISV